MKKRLLRVLLSISILLITAKLSIAQQGSGSGYYYDYFEYANQTAFNINWPNKSATATISLSTTTPLTIDGGTTSLASVKNTTTPNSVSNVLTTATSLDAGSVYWEWSMQYKFNSTTNLTDVTGSPISTSSTNAWKFWLAADSNTPSTCRGFYLTQKGSAIYLIEKNNTDQNGNTPGVLYDQIMSSGNLTSGTTYNIKVQRINTGSQILWRMYITANTLEATNSGLINTVLEPRNSNVRYTGYTYSILESITKDNTTTNYFQWDDIKMYTRATGIIDNNTASSGVISAGTPLYAGETDVVLFSFGLTDRTVLDLTTININVTGSPNGKLKNARLIRSVDPYYSTSNDNAQVGSTIQNVDPTTSFANVTEYIAGSPGPSSPLPAVVYYFFVVDVQNASTSTFQVSSGSISSSDQNYGSVINSGAVTGSTSGSIGNVYDWIGQTSPDWNVATNWSPNTVPGASDLARIGTNFGFSNLPVIGSPDPTTLNVGNILFGSVTSGSFHSVGVTVNSGYILNVNGDITMQSDGHIADNNPNPSNPVNLAGSGTIKAANLKITSSNTANFHAFTQILNSSVSNLTLSGNILLTSGYDSSNSLAFNSTFNLTGGITTVNNQLQSTNAANSTSTFKITPASTATLQLAGATALSGLSSSGTNVVTFNTAGSTVEYSGAAQTVYTDLAITGLSPGPSYANIKFSGTGAKTPNAGNLNVAGDFTNTLTNNTSNFLTLTSTPVIFNGSATSQSLAGGSGNGTMFNNVTFSGAGAKTMASGGFSVSPTGILTMGASASLATGGFLTLKSSIAGSASVDKFGTGASITGNVTVMRFVAGGPNRRNYRMFASPVNQGGSPGVLAGQLAFRFTDLQKGTMITGGGIIGTYAGGAPGTSFDPSPTGNPSVFFYYENDADPNTKVISKSDYKGISSINDKLPVGNGFLMFFRGNRSTTDSSGVSKTLTTAINPNSAYLSYVGALNQNGVNVYIPSPTINSSNQYITPGAAQQALTYTSHSTPLTDGFHLLGNPYACTIDLDNIGVVNPSTNFSIYMLNSTGSMGSYVRKSGITIPVGGVGRYVIAGQGFLFQGNTAGTTTVNFPETCKVTGIVSGSLPTTFAVAKPQLLAVDKNSINALKNSSVSTPADQPQQNLLINLASDSVNTNETLIHFADNTHNKFNPTEDAYYLSGLTQTTFLASYSSDAQPCIINQMGSLDSISTIKLYAEGLTSGLYTMKFSGASTIDPRYRLFLKDNLLKDSLDISANNTYSFNIDRANTKTYGADRFTISVQATHIGDLYSLVSFEGVKNISSVVLNWKTKYEGDYTGFTLQRSIDNGVTYNDITTLQSNGTGVYSYTDNNPAASTNKYRLVQNTIDNVNKISNIVTVSYLTINSDTNKMQVFPNPVADHIQIDLKTNITSTLLVKVYSVTGTKMIDAKFTPGSTLSVDVTKLTRGSYIIEVTDNNNIHYGSATFAKL